MEEAEDIWKGRDAWFKDEQGLTSSVFIEGTQEYYKATRYLPRGQAERPDDYLIRLRQADWKPKYRQAIEKDFSSILTQFTLKDVHPSIDDAKNDFDGAGNSLNVFVKDWVCQALHLGMAGVFVDFPSDNTAENIAQFREMGLRPTATMYPRSDVIDWDDDIINNRWTLTSITLRDWIQKEAPDDAPTRMVVAERYKRLYLAPYQATEGAEPEIRQWYEVKDVLEDDDGRPVEHIVDAGVTAAPRITFTPLGMSRKPFYSDLGLIHLARLNVQLYRKEANRDYYLDKCACPTLVANDLVQSTTTGARKGQKPGEKPPIRVAIGPNTVIRNMEAMWLELSGTAMAQIKEDINDLIQQLDEEALAFLSGSVNKTATQSMIDTFQTQANLIGMSTFLESATQQVFKDFAGYATGDFSIDDAGTIDLSQAIDMIKMAMNGDIESVFKAIFEGVISRQLGMTLLKQRGFFGRTFTDADLEREMRNQGFRFEQQTPQNGRVPTREPLGI